MEDREEKWWQGRGREEATSQDVTLCIQLHSACTGNGIDTREWKWKVDLCSSKASFPLQSTHSIAYMCTQSHALYTCVRSAATDILVIRIPVLESSIRTRPDMFYGHSRYHATWCGEDSDETVLKLVRAGSLIDSFGAMPLCYYASVVWIKFIVILIIIRPLLKNIPLFVTK